MSNCIVSYYYTCLIYTCLICIILYIYNDNFASIFCAVFIITIGQYTVILVCQITILCFHYHYLWSMQSQNCIFYMVTHTWLLKLQSNLITIWQYTVYLGFQITLSSLPCLLCIQSQTSTFLTFKLYSQNLNSIWQYTVHFGLSNYSTIGILSTSAKLAARKGQP